MKPKPKPPQSAPYDTESVLQAVAEKLREILDSMKTHGDGEHPAVVADIARISVALTTTCAELRQSAKARVREISTIPIDQIVAYLRTLPMETRLDIARDLTGADADQGLL